MISLLLSCFLILFYTLFINQSVNRKVCFFHDPTTIFVNLGIIHPIGIRPVFNLLGLFFTNLNVHQEDG